MEKPVKPWPLIAPVAVAVKAPVPTNVVNDRSPALASVIAAARTVSSDSAPPVVVTVKGPPTSTVPSETPPPRTDASPLLVSDVTADIPIVAMPIVPACSVRSASDPPVSETLEKPVRLCPLMLPVAVAANAPPPVNVVNDRSPAVASAMPCPAVTVPRPSVTAPAPPLTAARSMPPTSPLVRLMDPLLVKPASPVVASVRNTSVVSLVAFRLSAASASSASDRPARSTAPAVSIPLPMMRPPLANVIAPVPRSTCHVKSISPVAVACSNVTRANPPSRMESRDVSVSAAALIGAKATEAPPPAPPSLVPDPEPVPPPLFGAEKPSVMPAASIAASPLVMNSLAVKRPFATICAPVPRSVVKPMVPPRNAMAPACSCPPAMSPPACKLSPAEAVSSLNETAPPADSATSRPLPVPSDSRPAVVSCSVPPAVAVSDARRSARNVTSPLPLSVFTVA